MTGKPTALGINIFGGGFTLGVLQSHEFDVVGQWEECAAGARTFDLNGRYFGKIPRPIGYERWDFLGLPRVNLIYANPPCAPWSAANTAKGRNIDQRMSDPRLAMTARTMETALALTPDTFVCESVSRAFTQGRAYYDTWAERWLTAGYGVTYYVTDALLCGAPSTRERFHFVAHRNELGIDKVEKNFVPATAARALADLELDFGHLPHHVPKRFPAATHEAMRLCPPGRQLNEVAMDPNPCEKWSFLYRRGVWDAPAYTVIGVEMQVHPRQSRLITAREGLRLCGYPDDFVVHESEMTKAPTQAVLPPVGLHVARLARESMDRGRAQRELEVVDHRDLARPYRPGTIRDMLEEEAL